MCCLCPHWRDTLTISLGDPGLGFSEEGFEPFRTPSFLCGLCPYWRDPLILSLGDPGFDLSREGFEPPRSLGFCVVFVFIGESLFLLGILVLV